MDRSRWRMFFCGGNRNNTDYVQFFLLFYWASLIGTNVYGSGLHFENVPMDWRPMHWHVRYY
jgi:hypothetical protein